MFSAQRAKEIVGKPRSEYQCNHVVNYVLNGSKDVGGLARSYLQYGTRAEKPEAGVVVVGTDGVHVGIFISSNRFIHSSLSKQQVIEVGMEQLQYVFPKGYELRK